MTAIPITKAVFGPEEMRAVQQPLETGWVVQGPFVEQFERKFGAFTGSKFSVATSSCTTALHLAVAALELEPEAEVIVPALTWISTANVVEYQHAKPVFCDIELDTFNIDPARIEALLTPRTAGLIPVHLFGLCAEMDPILELARRRKLWVVEDAACAFGGFYRGRHAGTFGETGAFSFHPRKSITTGEGGMISTESAAFDKLVRSLRDHGASRSDRARHEQKAAFLLSEYHHLGYNYRMTDIQGALGCAQIDRATWILSERGRRARRYDELLANLAWLRTPRVPAGHVHGYQAYVCLFAPEQPSLANVAALHERRNRLMQRLEAQGIATRQGTHAPIALDFYAKKYHLRVEAFPNAWIADRLSLALPLYPQMTDEEQDRVVAALREGPDA
jgi:dTDP-4-amino-4,6-dideoxygalactose transaminase